MPRCPSTRLERNAGTDHPGWSWGLKEWIEAYIASEVFSRPRSITCSPSTQRLDAESGSISTP